MNYFKSNYMIFYMCCHIYINYNLHEDYGNFSIDRVFHAVFDAPNIKRSRQLLLTIGTASYQLID